MQICAKRVKMPDIGHVVARNLKKTPPEWCVTELRNLATVKFASSRNPQVGRLMSCVAGASRSRTDRPWMGSPLPANLLAPAEEGGPGRWHASARTQPHLEAYLRHEQIPKERSGVSEIDSANNYSPVTSVTDFTMRTLRPRGSRRRPPRGVPLRGGDRRMTEQRLHRPQVATAAVGAGGETVDVASVSIRGSSLPASGHTERANATARGTRAEAVCLLRPRDQARRRPVG